MPLHCSVSGLKHFSHIVLIQTAIKKSYFTEKQNKTLLFFLENPVLRMEQLQMIIWFISSDGHGRKVATNWFFFYGLFHIIELISILFYSISLSVCMCLSSLSFRILFHDSLGYTVTTLAWVSCFWLTGVLPYVVFCSCSPNTSRFSMLRLEILFCSPRL